MGACLFVMGRPASWGYVGLLNGLWAGHEGLVARTVGQWARTRRGHKGLVDRAVIWRIWSEGGYGAMRLQPIGKNRVMKLKWVGRQQNFNLKGTGILRKPRSRGSRYLKWYQLQNGGGFQGQCSVGHS